VLAEVVVGGEREVDAERPERADLDLAGEQLVPARAGDHVLALDVVAVGHDAALGAAGLEADDAREVHRLARLVRLAVGEEEGARLVLGVAALPDDQLPSTVACSGM
jgi:hypothetical protein